MRNDAERRQDLGRLLASLGIMEGANWVFEGDLIPRASESTMASKGSRRVVYWAHILCQRRETLGQLVLTFFQSGFAKIRNTFLAPKLQQKSRRPCDKQDLFNKRGIYFNTNDTMNTFSIVLYFSMTYKSSWNSS